MNTFVYYHSALLAHFPPDDTKIAEELHGDLRESPHNRNFEETVNLIVLSRPGKMLQNGVNATSTDDRAW